MKSETELWFLFKFLTIIIFLLTLDFVVAQKITINGIVKDKISGEKLNSVKIYVGSHFIESNKFGYYNISTISKKATLLFFLENYKSFSIDIIKDTVLNVELERLNFDLEEVVIKTEKDTYSDLQGNFTLPIEWIKNRPTIFGEADILKAIQFLPGVQAGTEGTSGIYVRGGSPDQTLILVDGVPVYNVYHFFGFFSIFNPDAVSAVKVYKNDLPARYGGRLSSVIDLTMREGNNKERKGSFSFSPISGKFSIEGPLIKGKASYIITGRKTWLDLITTSLQKIIDNGSFLAYSFYDLNAKVNYELTKKNHLYLSLYTGRDLFNNQNETGRLEYNKYQFDWGNYTAIGRWNKIIGQKLFKNTTLSYTKYSYNIENQIKSRRESFFSQTKSDIRDWSLKTDFEYLPSLYHTTRFGVGVTNHRFAPEILQVKEEIGEPTTKGNENPPIIVQDLQGYIEQKWQPNAKLSFNGGLNYNALWVNHKFYHSIQPRFNLNYEFAKNWGIRAAFFNTVQYLHLLANSSLGLPTDLWVPITEKIPPQSANQFSIGGSKKWRGLILTIDLYLKKMYNQLEYLEGTSFLNDFSGGWFEKVTVGVGESKGLEIFLQKNHGKMTGFLSYTLSKTTRTFEELNQGTPFPFKYDRTHNLSLNSSYHFNKRCELSLVFSIMSGSLLSLPTSRFSSTPPPLYVSESSNIKQYYLDFFKELGHLPNRNNFRLPLYHRLDLNYRATKPKKKGNRTWIFSVYNAYNRQNAFFIYPENGKLKQFSLFPVVPSISYERNF